MQDGSFIYDRHLSVNLPQTEVRRLQNYVLWQSTNSPGEVAPIENFGIKGAVQSDTYSFDPDLNLDRFLIKLRVPKALANIGDNVVVAVLENDVLIKTVHIDLIQDPLIANFLITESPILMYDDPDDEFDPATIAQYLPNGTLLLDPPQLTSKIQAFIGNVSGNPVIKANVSNYVLTRISQLFWNRPEIEPSLYHAYEEAVITSPAQTADWRLLYSVGANDSTPDIRIAAIDPKAELGPPSTVQWFVSVSFHAGDTDFPSHRIFRIDSQWHVVSTEAPLTFDTLNGGILTALEADQLTNALGPADFALFSRMVIPTVMGPQIYESNLITFRIVGSNVGNNAAQAQADIAAFIDNENAFSINPGGPVTDAIATRLNPSMKAWFKSILKHESGSGGYTNRIAWDNFERNPETAGIDLGFQRSVSYSGVVRRWLARYGWPFVSVDNGYGIAQLTNPSPDYRNISRWKNNIYKSWRILTIDKLRVAIPYMAGLKGAGLTQDDDEALLREVVKEYNGGHQYDGYSNGQFVLGPTPPNVNYVQLVFDAGRAAGWL